MVFYKSRKTFNLTFLFIFIPSIVFSKGLHKVGHRNVSLTFETVTQSLTEEIEKSYELFIVINSSNGPTPFNAFLPSQHMLVVQKNSNQELVFKRDEKNIITGLVSQTVQLDSIVGRVPYQNAVTRSHDYGQPFKWPDESGYEILPVSTGTGYHMPTFSGVYQINWSRSQSMHEESFSEPMSNQIYLGYFYHQDSIPKEQWRSSNRERISHAAIHGTPDIKTNWRDLGRVSASHGCARLLPEYMKAIKRHIHLLDEKKVIELDWDHPLAVIDYETPLVKRKPVLVIIFNGYDQTSKSI